MADFLDAKGNLISSKAIGAAAGRAVADALRTHMVKAAGGIDPDLVRSAELMLSADRADIVKAAAALSSRLGMAQSGADVPATADWILAQGGQLQAEAARVRAQSQNTVLDRKIREGLEHRASELDRRVEKALASPAPAPGLLTTKAAKAADAGRRNALLAEAARYEADAAKPGLRGDFADAYRTKAEALRDAAGR